VSNPRGSLEEGELRGLAPGTIFYEAGTYWEAWMPKDRVVAGNGMVESHLFTEFADAERWLQARLAELAPELDADGESVTCYDGLIQDAKRGRHSDKPVAAWQALAYYMRNRSGARALAGFSARCDCPPAGRRTRPLKPPGGRDAYGPGDEAVGT
jgi:hypothetical protein